MIVWIAGLARAAPFQMLEPADTMPASQTEMGVAVGMSTFAADPGLGPVALSAWARYGLSGRFEVGGGVWLPLAPFDIGIQGGGRLLVLGEAGEDGVQLSAGLSLGATAYGTTGGLHVVAPISLGLSTGGIDAWGTGSVGYYPAYDVVTVGGEVGLAVETSGIPVYFVGQLVQGEVAVVGLAIGLGYHPEL